MTRDATKTLDAFELCALEAVRAARGRLATEEDIRTLLRLRNAVEVALMCPPEVLPPREVEQLVVMREDIQARLRSVAPSPIQAEA